MRSKRTSRYRDLHQDDEEGSDHEEKIGGPVTINKAISQKEESKTLTNEDEEFLRFAEQMQRLERGEKYVEIVHK
jgi:hypothetical protein